MYWTLARAPPRLAVAHQTNDARLAPALGKTKHLQQLNLARHRVSRLATGQIARGEVAGPTVGSGKCSASVAAPRRLTRPNAVAGGPAHRSDRGGSAPSRRESAY